MKTQATEQPVPVEEIIKELYQGATRVTGPGADFHSVHIRNALHRAAKKTFVRAVKPFRRLFRNQGAVNDSLIEALYHLSNQTQEMIEQMEDLQRQLSKLQAQLQLRSADSPGTDSKPAAE